MKMKNQPHLTIEHEAKERLIVYVYEYLVNSGAKQAADTFKESIGYNKEIQVNESPGFLSDWWCVFWDLYRATHERRNIQPESSSEARAFHEFTRRTPMSPSMIQTSPLQQQAPPPPQYIAAGPPRYGPPPHPGLRGPPPSRMQAQPQHGPPPGSFVPGAGPRYAQHQGPPGHLQQQQQQPHMSQPGGPMGFGPPPPNQMGSSPGAMNRMTPVGGPQQMLGPGGLANGPPPPPQPISQQQQQPPPQQAPSQMIGMPPGQAPSPVGSMQSVAGPPRNGSQGSVGGWPPSNQMAYGNVSSPAQQSMFNSGPGSNQPSSQSGGGGGGGGGNGSTSVPMMMTDTNLMEVKNSPIISGDPSTPHSEEYVMPVPFGQDTSDQCESEEIMKLKQSMQEDTTKMFEKEQSEFNLDYSDSQNKWS